MNDELRKNTICGTCQAQPRPGMNPYKWLAKHYRTHFFQAQQDIKALTEPKSHDHGTVWCRNCGSKPRADEDMTTWVTAHCRKNYEDFQGQLDYYEKVANGPTGLQRILSRLLGDS